MSVSGKPSEGDVVLEKDGYVRIYLTNSNGVWYHLYLSPEHKGEHMWVSEPRTAPLSNTDTKLLLNLKDLLKTVRKEMLDESSS